MSHWYHCYYKVLFAIWFLLRINHYNHCTTTTRLKIPERNSRRAVFLTNCAPIPVSTLLLYIQTFFAGASCEATLAYIGLISLSRVNLTILLKLSSLCWYYLYNHWNHHHHHITTTGTSSTATAIYHIVQERGGGTVIDAIQSSEAGNFWQKLWLATADRGAKPHQTQRIPPLKIAFQVWRHGPTVWAY